MGLVGIHQPTPAINYAAIKSLDELYAWLRSKNIDYAEWGLGTAKTVENLWQEIETNESYIQDSPPRRLVTAVQLLIYQKGRVLIEYEQEFKDGRRRTRFFRPSDKMRPGETYSGVAIRCLHEELDASRDRVTIHDDTYLHVVSQTRSLSYPGLMTLYTSHVLGADVDGLPDTDFWTEEKNPHSFVARHHWIWH